MKNNNGITLVALIVTIVVLIIIAGVSLNIALGENGIFTKSKQAVDEYKKAAAAEKTELDSVFASLENASEGGMPVAQVLLNAGYSVAKIDTGYLAADTENDMLYTMDENGGIVSRETLQYTDESAFTFNSSTGAITGITLTSEITATERIVVPKTIGGVKVKKVNLSDGPMGGISGISLVILPYGVEEIGVPGFMGIKSIITVTMPNTISNLRYQAFYGCTSLKTIMIPSNVSNIEYTPVGTAFTDCKGLTEVIAGYLGSEDELRNLSNINKIIILNSVNEIGIYSCAGTGIVEVKLPNSVLEIGNGAFYNCSSLEKVYIPSSVTTINTEAFNGIKSGSIIYVETEAVKNLLVDGTNYDSSRTTIVVDPSKF